MLYFIHHRATLAATAPPLVIAHGLFGSARNWGVIARRLADTRNVYAVDMRNHGDSPHLPSHNYPDMAADLAEVIHTIGGPVDILGHSMGGKAAMQLALTHPELLRSMIVADIAPVAYTHDQTQHIASMQSLDLSQVTTRGQADDLLTPRIPDASLRAFFLQSLDLKTTPPRWRLNLDALADQMPNIVGWPETQGAFTGPTLFLSGATSHYVLPEYRPKIQALFPKARFAKLAGAGHWLHAEQPRAFEDTARLFLNAL
jgi:esterase